MKLRWIVLPILIILGFYRTWFFSHGSLASGDWPYLFKETIQSFSFVPSPDFLWLGPYYQWTSKISVQFLNMPWQIYERIFWFWMFLAISFFSSWYFSKVVLGESKFNFLSIIIFLTNTYIFMIVGGGQMGVALAYALSPAVLGSSIELFCSSNLKQNIKYVRFILLLSLQLMFDPRIFYITNVAILLFIVFVYSKKNTRKFLTFLCSNLFALIINSFWILPFFFGKKIAENNSLLQKGSLQFFSFARFEDAFSLLHPNWPENLFGKAYFLRPEFLILPLLAFSSLLFIKKAKEFKRAVVYFGLLGLLGIFLSKGTQEPFGFIYSLMFDHIPGFFLFRDPTKFYLLIVLSYMILIPFSIEQISNKVKSSKFKVQSFIPVLFVLFWCFLIRQAIFGQLSGTFKPHEIPNDYVLLKNFLFEDKHFSKTLWIPSRNIYTFYSNTHPFLEGTQLFGTLNVKTIPTIFNDQKNKDFIKTQHVRYIILAEDTEGNLFTEDRKYSDKVYENVLKSIRSVKNLKQTAQFGKIVVFEPTW